MDTRRTRIFWALAITACTAAAQEREYRDPRSFPFHEAVSNPEQVVVTQRSTTGYGNHPRGSDDFLHNLIGGSGYLRVHVSPGDVTVDYVQTYLPGEEDEARRDGMVAHSDTIAAE